MQLPWWLRKVMLGEVRGNRKEQIAYSNQRDSALGFGGVWMRMLELNRPPDPDLVWEEVAKQEGCSVEAVKELPDSTVLNERARELAHEAQLVK